MIIEQGFVGDIHDGNIFTEESGEFLEGVFIILDRKHTEMARADREQVNPVWLVRE